MLDRFRGNPPEADAFCSVACSVAWANLRWRYPRARTILITGASSRDDAEALYGAALGLAEAAGRLESSSVLVIVLDSARQTPNVLASSAASVSIVGALSPAQVRAALSGRGEKFAFAIVVAPAPQKSPDCISLAYAADAAVLVARSGRTRFGEAQLATKLLRQAGLPIAAAMLLKRSTPRSEKPVEAGDSRLLGHAEGVAES
jgi:hypothetical protein